MHIPIGLIILAAIAWLIIGVWRPIRAERKRLQDIRRSKQLLYPHLTPAQVEAEVDLYRR